MPLPSLHDVCAMVQQEAESLKPQRALTSTFKQMRNLVQTHPTLLENLIYRAWNCPLALLFLLGCCKSTPPIEKNQLIGFVMLTEMQRFRIHKIIFFVRTSLLFDIADDILKECACLNEQTGALAYDLEKACNLLEPHTDQLSEHDKNIVTLQANNIFDEVERLCDYTSLADVSEFAWWYLSPWLACILAICGSLSISVNPINHSVMIDMIARISNGDFAANRFAADFVNNPLLRLHFGR